MARIRPVRSSSETWIRTWFDPVTSLVAGGVETTETNGSSAYAAAYIALSSDCLTSRVGRTWQADRMAGVIRMRWGGESAAAVPGVGRGAGPSLPAVQA